MKALTVGWLVFLALKMNSSTKTDPPFKLEGAGSTVNATEGSCIEIKCTLTRQVDVATAYWFWIKDAFWEKLTEWTGTVIYSSNTTARSVSPDFAGRVNYTASPPLNPELWGILICNLNKTDSGNYSFRYVGTAGKIWINNQKKPLILTVIENPCPITFEKPAAVKENEKITLTCSTLNSCPSNLQIGGWTQQNSRQPQSDGRKSTSVSFAANLQDDGKEFSCQTEDNKDEYLIRNITVTVEYAPKEVIAEISTSKVVEGQSVTLNCSAKGRPDPTFRWFKEGESVEQETRAVWTITSIEESQNGKYYCEAENEHGKIKSGPVIIDVIYKPEVELTPPASNFKQGDKMTLTCEVKRSNPKPHTYVWLMNDKVIRQETQHYVVERIEPEDKGFYTCSATNTVGNGTSEKIEIKVEYGPRKTSISIDDEVYDEVKVGARLTFTCSTDAYPAPENYSWYRHNDNKRIDSSQWKTKTTVTKDLTLERVQRGDEACYTCNATNIINAGENSEKKCIQVLYAPTKPMLSMDTEVTEGQLITITCTVESSPPSQLTLITTSRSIPQHPERQPNTLQYKFNVTSAHAGSYTCKATNSEGSDTSEKRPLEVKYCPKDVTVEAEPSLVVIENKTLTLRCTAQSHPPLTSVTWVKMANGKRETWLRKTQPFSLKSVSPSDSGLYSCKASNEIGTGDSEQVDVKVQYAPKHTNIIQGPKQELPDGTSSVTLSCSSHSEPRVAQYTWYKIKAEEGDEKVSGDQNYTVNSNEPGGYYCIAKNKINQQSSEPIHLFGRGLIKALQFIFLCLLILFIIFLIVLVKRYKTKRSVQQGSTNTLPRFGFLGARGRNRMNESSMAEPFRSRDDLLPDQPCRPKAAQRCQPRPDSTPASNISTVYCTVNLPPAKQGPSAQKPNSQQGGHTQDDSLNYASLHFGNKQKKKQTNAEVDVYAMVSKQKPPKKNEETLEDYENAETACTAKSPNPNLDYETDTSEDEVELSYSQVSFKAKPGHERAYRDSSSSDEETQYSEVKI